MGLYVLLLIADVVKSKKPAFNTTWTAWNLSKCLLELDFISLPSGLPLLGMLGDALCSSLVGGVSWHMLIMASCWKAVYLLRKCYSAEIICQCLLIVMIFCGEWVPEVGTLGPFLCADIDWLMFPLRKETAAKSICVCGMWSYTVCMWHCENSKFSFGNNLAALSD